MRFIFLVFFASSSLLADVCAFQNSSTILVESGDPSQPGSSLLQVWDEEDASVFWSSSLPSSKSLNSFRTRIATKVPTLVQSDLLRMAIGLPPLNADSLNAQEALRGQARWIHPMGCLEALLLSYQTDRLDMVTTPTEFLAFVLKSKTDNHLRIYSYTVNKPEIGKVGPISSVVEKDLSTGQWRPLANIHNHNFRVILGKPGGVVAPSATDVGAFRSAAQDFGLESAWVTNGFDTLKLGQADFATFHTATER